MDPLAPVISYTARYVFPVAGPPIPGGWVTTQGARIVAVGPSRASLVANARSVTIDLGNVAILPGLVNAHTHLEFSHLEAPLGRPGIRLPDWIPLVIAARRAAADIAPPSPIARGLIETTWTGTTTIGEIMTAGSNANYEWTEAALNAAEGAADIVAFYELIGLAADRASEKLADAEQFVAAVRRATTWRGGLSPHAPYSVHPELVVGLSRLAARHGLPVAMHLAESPEELELLAQGTGPFREMLVDLGAWDPAAIPRGTRPLQYLQLLAEAPRALVIHGNYLNSIEIEFLAMHPERMSIVYCPRTHAYFGHEPYPLERLLKLGANVALGTDSRASNPDLSMLAEMRYVAHCYPAIPPEAVLRMGTLAAATALGCGDRAGTLEPGKFADFAVVALPEHESPDPYERLLGTDLPVVAPYLRDRHATAGNS